MLDRPALAERPEAALGAPIASPIASAGAPILQLESPVCDLCGSSEQRNLYLVRDRKYQTPGEFQLVECTKCSLRYLCPRPISSTIHNWYPNTYTAYKKKAPTWFQRVGDFFEDRIWNSYLRLFLSRTYPIFYFPKHAKDFATPDRAPRILDVGCGSGDKLRYIREHSPWDTYGVDFSAQAVENANARGAGDVRLRTDHRLPFDDGHFDAIMSWHSLEHHYSPKATMTEAARVLRPGGYGIFAVPSGNNVGMRMFRSYWGPLEAPRHLYYFTKQTLSRLMDECGLKVHKVVYDFSFYGLFFDQEILWSLEFLARDKLGWLGWPFRIPLKILQFEGLISSLMTLPILPLNPVLGRLWRGSNMIVHFTKPEHP
jgi:SAM-dependent methyltransferase